MPIYTLSELLCEKNTPLYNEISQSQTIELQDSNDGQWYHVYDESAKKHVIECSKTDKPHECFTHELLHAKMYCDGFVDPLFTDETGDPDIHSKLIGHLRNIFQHFIMYDQFIKLGFDGQNFILDEDSVNETIDTFLLDYEEIKKGDGQPPKSLHVAIQYLTLVSPPTIKNASALKTRFEDTFGASFLKLLDKVIEDWKADCSLNLSFTLAKFFAVCGYKNIGFSNTENQEDMIVSGNLSRI